MVRQRQSKKGKKKQSKKKNNQHTNIPPSTTLTSRVSDVCSILINLGITVMHTIFNLSIRMMHAIFNLSTTVIFVAYLVMFNIIRKIYNAIISIKLHRELPKLPADMNTNAVISYRYYSELVKYYNKYWVSPYTAHKKAKRIIDSDKTFSPA